MADTKYTKQRTRENSYYITELIHEAKYISIQLVITKAITSGVIYHGLTVTIVLIQLESPSSFISVSSTEDVVQVTEKKKPITKQSFLSHLRKKQLALRHSDGK